MEDTKIFNLPILPALACIMRTMEVNEYRNISKLNICSWLEEFITFVCRYTYDIEVDSDTSTKKAQELSLNGYKLSNQSLLPKEFLEYLIESIRTYSIYVLIYIIPMGNIEVIYYDAISIKFKITKSLINQEDNTW